MHILMSRDLHLAALISGKGIRSTVEDRNAIQRAQLRLLKRHEASVREPASIDQKAREFAV